MGVSVLWVVVVGIGGISRHVFLGHPITDIQGVDLLSTVDHPDGFFIVLRHNIPRIHRHDRRCRTFRRPEKPAPLDTAGYSSGYGNRHAGLHCNSFQARNERIPRATCRRSVCNGKDSTLGADHPNRTCRSDNFLGQSARYWSLRARFRPLPPTNFPRRQAQQTAFQRQG